MSLFSHAAYSNSHMSLTLKEYTNLPSPLQQQIYFHFFSKTQLGTAHTFLTIRIKLSSVWGLDFVK